MKDEAAVYTLHADVNLYGQHVNYHAEAHLVVHAARLVLYAAHLVSMMSTQHLLMSTQQAEAHAAHLSLASHTERSRHTECACRY